ncbi:hypothetical protein PLESTB_001819000 [Pleodorina starrii]|uniref:tubulin-glutamate carboxypeptidase n=1 Tax=Pleodorina starrii TaxID=330485 RepID=A0A9W6C1U3_9CHLO|nr:hypothetical protein PLESTM_000969800 [Pleodorina starrii]GLC61915.1 hypothetical protein PLESTB_001819000 [Pleodorina starrii]
MSGSENDVVFARLKSLQDTIKSLKPGKSDATIVAVVQEVLGFLLACSAQDVVNAAIKVLEDGIVLSPQAGTILRLEGGLKQVIKHLKAATGLAAVAGPCARILAVAAATSTVTQQALAKEKGVGALLLNACALHVKDPAISGPACEALAHIARAPKGAMQLECDSLLPVMQEMLVSYLGNWPVFGWVLKLLKNLAKYEYLQSGSTAFGGGGAAAAGGGGAAPRGASGILTCSGEGVRLLLGVARVLARIPEQRKLLKRVSRTLWLLCPHVLTPLPPLEPLVPLPLKDAPHLMVASAAETDTQRHQELFPEEYPWQQLPLPQALQLQQQQSGNNGAAAPVWQGVQTSGSITVRPTGNMPARPPSARQTSRHLAAFGGSGGASGGPVDVVSGASGGLGQSSEPFHGYGTSLDCEMMLHDLQRIANPRSLINRVAYMNTSAAGGGGGVAVGAPLPPFAPRESQPLQPTLRSTPAPPPDPTAWLAEAVARGPDSRAASGTFPELARLTLSEPAEVVPVLPTTLSTRATSSPELDPFHLPNINGEPWPRSDAGGLQAVLRTSGRFAPPSGPPGAAAGPGGGARPPSPSSVTPPLAFHSNFESGNLRCAAQVGPREYDLFLAPDLNDRSEGGNLCQWFYFAVTVPPGACSGGGWAQQGQSYRGPGPGGAGGGGGGGSGLAGGGSSGTFSPLQQQAELQASLESGSAAGGGGGGGGAPLATGLGQGPGIKMNIVNLRKKESLFSAGKRPVMCLARPADCGGDAPSTPRSRPGSAPSPTTDPGVWFRAGSHISYYPSPYRGRPTIAGEGAASRKGKKPSVAATAAAAAAAASAAGGGGSGGTGNGGVAASAGATGAATQPSGKKTTKGKGKSATTADGADGDGVSGPSITAIGPGLYCASFTLHFPVPGTYYVASCYPYTYTDLQDYLEGLQRRLAAESSSPSPASQQQRQPPLQPQLAQPQQQQQTSLPSPLLPSALLPPPPPLVRSVLCYSLTGLRVDLLTITDWSSPLEAVRQRECIFITARVHPGETCASWLMQGMLEFLCSSDPAAVTLRNSFVFKLVPMLNPDGVVNGNYRCSLAGVDLNRVWDRPVRCLYPTVYHSKRVLQQLAAAGRLALYIDIHGHSTKSDTFFYGCEPSAAALAAQGKAPPVVYASPSTRNGNGAGDGEVQTLPQSQQQQQQQVLPGCGSGAGGGAAGAAALSIQGNGYGGGGGGGVAFGSSCAGPYASATNTQTPGPASASIAPPTSGPSPRVAARLRVRMLPYLTARISSDFSFPKCSFKIRKAKLSAARVVVHRELGVAGSYTLEASLAGSSASATHFSARDYLAMGHNLCRAICELAEVDDAALLEEMNARISLPPL